MHTMYRLLFLSLLLLKHFLPKGEGYVSKCAVGSRVGMSKLKKFDLNNMLILAQLG